MAFVTRRRSALALLAFGLIVLALGGPTTQATSFQAKINPEVLKDTANGKTTDFVVYMAKQADLSKAASIKDQDARGWYVYNALKTAARSQKPLLGALDAHDVDYTSYWGVNMVALKGGRSLAESLAARADVRAIETNRAFVALDAIGEPGDGEATDETDQVEIVDAATPGVTSTQAPTLWNLGFRGQGMVVANQDTGMRWTHAALRTHYRGWGGSIATSDHNYNWWDSIHARITGSDGGTASGATNSCGYNLQAPCDDQGHGTHTTGTTVGDDAGAGLGTGTNQVGVAPSAKWIGCRNMDAGNGRATTYTECFQFFLAPTNLQGQNPDPTKRPHVMNNSWGCPLVGELCPRPIMQSIVDNSVASGIFVVASAGNDGPNCGTVQDPPGIYESAFSIGALSTSNTAPSLQSFSSRGTVTSDGSGRMKPDLSAPGASVSSSLRTSDTSYGSMSGTSMASPHVVGTVALLWSARPGLVRDIPRTKWLLTRSSNRAGITVGSNSTGCGGITPTPNNHFGWGRVDVTAAYNLEPSLNQTITFAPLAPKTWGDGDFVLEATASSNLPVSYSASGQCTVTGATVHITGAGSCDITASQAGLDAYSIANTAPKPWYPAVSVTQPLSIAKAGQTIAFEQPAPKTWGDADFDVSPTSSSGLPVGLAASGDCTVTGATVHITSAGSCTLTASQGGSDNYNAAEDVARTFTIAKADQEITFAPIADRTWGDPDFDVAPASSVGLPVSIAAEGDCSLSGNTVHITSAGSCTLTASQPGNGNYNAAPDVQRSFAISRAEQTIAFAPIAGRTWGDPDFDVEPASSAGLPVSVAAAGDCSVAHFTVHITGAGSCTLTASQGGNGNFKPAPDVDRSFAISKAQQTITFGPLANKTHGVNDDDFELGATSSSGLPVSYSANGPCTVSGRTVHITGVGDCTITAAQGGGRNFFAAPDVSRTFRISYPFTGFFQPIDNGITNVANAGSAVPVKFSLGSAAGLAIFAAGYPLSGKSACGIGGAEDPIEQTATPGSSTLTYDPGTGQYHYVWKTDKAWAGTCRALTVKFVDNTVHIAYFRFR
jgi:subtilisin family serine protease